MRICVLGIFVCFFFLQEIHKDNPYSYLQDDFFHPGALNFSVLFFNSLNWNNCTDI